jgi:ferredoxin-NADP reductase
MSTDHLRELIPDLADREVYLCGPPGMMDAIEANVRAAGVPRKYIHTERFGF